MKTFVQIALSLCFVLVIQANDFQTLSDMTNYDFGKTIIETVQIELQQGSNSADAIVQQLREMKESSQNEIKDDEVLFQKRDAQCTQQLEELVGQIKQTYAKRADDENQVPLKEESLNDKDNQLQDKQQTEQRNQDQIQILVQQRKADSSAFTTRNDEMQGLIDTLSEAKRTISQLTSSNSFLQKPEQINNKLQQHQQKLKGLTNQNQGYLSLVQILIETALDSSITLDQKLVITVIQVIDELIDSIHNLQAIERTADSDKNQLFLQQQVRLQDEITNLEGTLAGLRAEKLILSQTLLELNNDISTKTQIADAKNQQFKDIKKTCSDQSNIHQKTNQQKNDELSIIIQCLEIFETRFTEALRSYIQKMQILE